MIRPAPGLQRRVGIAAVEMAVLLVPLVLLWLGIVEVGRLVQVSQIVTNAAREGARIAAQGVNVQVVGNFVYVYTNHSSSLQPSTNPLYVSDVVNSYIVAAGVTNTGGANAPTTTFVNTTTPASVDPWQGVKGDLFTVTVTLPYPAFRLTKIGWFNIISLTETVNWGMLTNDPLTVVPTIPNWQGSIPG